MTEPKRWTPAYGPNGSCCYEKDDGDYVLARDYDDLAADFDRLRDERDRWRAEAKRQLERQVNAARIADLERSRSSVRGENVRDRVARVIARAYADEYGWPHGEADVDYRAADAVLALLKRDTRSDETVVPGPWGRGYDDGRTDPAAWDGEDR